MEYRTLGRTGLRVSEIGFGGAPAGLSNYLGAMERRGPGGGAAGRGRHRASRRAGDQLLRHRARLRRWLERGDVRSGAQAAPRAGRPGDEGQAATEDEIRESVEASLARLQIDHLDVIQYHGGWYTDDDVDRMLAPGGALTACASCGTTESSGSSASRQKAPTVRRAGWSRPASSTSSRSATT